MQIIDTKTTYLDDAGEPLSGGRLRFFAFGTTAPVFVYADADYVTNLGTTVALTNAGWTATQVYANQSVNVHVDKFLGLDEFGAESYEQIKVYDVLVSASGSAGADSAIVDTIADLRNVSPTSKAAVSVKGYYEAGDAFIRTYIWDENAMAMENLGTVIESNLTPDGRWLLAIEGPYVDCRIFGVIAGGDPTTSNSALSGLITYCTNYKRTAYFPSGAYYLTSGGSLTVGCAIKADKDIKINSNSGEYTLTITNPDFDVVNTFAGTGLKLKLSGSDNWSNTIIPITIWNTAAKGYDISTARYILRLNNGSTVYNWTGVATEIEKIICDSGTHYITGEPNVYVHDVEGAGKIQWSTTATFAFRQFRTSMTTNYASIVSTRVAELLTVDTAITFATGTIIGALIYVMPSGSVAFGASCQADKGVVGYHGCIKGSNGFTSDAEVDICMYDLPNTAMKSWNLSSATNAFDLKSRTVTVAPTKSGKFINGNITADVAVDMILDNVTYIGYCSGESLTANRCLLKHNTKPFGGGTTTNLTDCTVYAPASVTIEDGIQSFWTRVKVQAGSVIKTGSGGVWRDVWLDYYAIFAPGANKSFGNFSWVGGSAYKIDLDANRCPVDGACTMYNIRIQNLIYLPGKIRAIPLNTSAKYWANSGHYNVIIGDNENSPATYGFAKSTQTFGGDSIIELSRNSTDILWLTEHHQPDEIRTFTKAWNINSCSQGNIGPAWSGEGWFAIYPQGGIPWVEGTRTRGVVIDDDQATYQFEIYKKVF